MLGVKRSGFVIGLSLLVLAFSQRAWAQTAANGAATSAQQNSPAGPNGGRGARSHPQMPQTTDPVPIGYATQQNGGSLLRASLATPDSDKSTVASVSLFAVPEPQPKTMKKHDLVTIIVREESAFTSQGTTDLKRNADLDAKLDQFIAFKLSQLELHGITPGGTVAPEIKAEMNRDFKGDATVDRTDSLTARITAEIVDVKPNGTLVLQASKKIKTDDEEQQFILTGICRVDDVSADNSILSTQLFNLELTKTHKGAVRDTTNRGILQRLLDQVGLF